MTLLITDLHLTDRPQDRYRFDLFPWVKKMIEKHNQKDVFILGDLTDSKDGHSAKLVNKIVEELTELATLCDVTIIAGNHDSIDPTTPFFKFLSDMDGLLFIHKPMPLTIARKKCWFLPHTRDVDDWKVIKDSLKNADYIFMHQTVDQAIASNGFKLDGIKSTYFRGFKGKIFSGDIHVPQILGKVTYVGSPYSIRFNDHFDPRAMLLALGSGKTKDLYFDTLRKWTLKITDPKEILEDEELRPGDQVKVIMKIKRHDIVSWSELRRQILNNCDAMGIEVFDVKLQSPKVNARVRLNTKEEQKVSVEPVSILRDYCKRQKVQETFKKTGIEILKGTFDVQVPLG